MKTIEKAQADKQIISAMYNVPLSSIVWMGNNKYILIKSEGQIIVTL